MVYYSNDSLFIAHAAYFSVYEASKDFLDSHPMQASISGGLAAVSHDVFMVPFDVIKQRMQLGYYNSMLHCIKTIWKTEGVMGFYASFPTTLMMNVPYGLVMVPVNEAVRNALNPKKTYSFMASMIAGCVAGATAAAITNPLDVIKTRLQTQILETCPLDDTKKIFGSAVIPSSYSAPNTEVINPLKNKNLVSNMIQTIKRIVAEDGYRGFLRGIVPRMIIHTPSVAISWTTYEALKSFLKPVDSE